MRYCNCHKKLAEAMRGGMTFYEARAKHSKPGYHAHRCDCACGCSQDTQGYALCATCSFGGCKREPLTPRYRWSKAPEIYT